MAGLASPSTAEHVLGAVEAVVAAGGAANTDLVAEFLETSAPRATAALELGVELGLLESNSTQYHAASPLSRFCSVAEQRAAVLRIVVESYEPFIKFRERLVATADVGLAARQTKTICGLAADRDEVKDTLISLGTFSNALVTQGAGEYQLETGSLENALQTLALACTDAVAAEARIRSQLGPRADAVVSRADVILPLAEALVLARKRDGAGAVQRAGNAVESHIDAMAGRMGVVLGSATGIMSKLNKFVSPTRKLPSKLIHIGSYLGAIRNAADHGIDVDLGTSWQIRDATALEYVFASCSFIAATVGVEQCQPAEI